MFDISPFSPVPHHLLTVLCLSALIYSFFPALFFLSLVICSLILLDTGPLLFSEHHYVMSWKYGHVEIILQPASAIYLLCSSPCHTTICSKTFVLLAVISATFCTESKHCSIHYMVKLCGHHHTQMWMFAKLLPQSCKHRIV